MTVANAGSPPADWYCDPWESERLRYWDGYRWTWHVCVRMPPPEPGPAVAGAGTPGRAVAPGPAPAGDDPGWTDLAENRPGQAVRQKALELRAAAPFRTFLARLLGVNTDERAFRIGADGEESVARRLRRLDASRWRVLHSLPVAPNVDIDHLVIGPGGVFTLNTKHHPGKKVWVAERTFLVSGYHQSYLPKSSHEGRRVEHRLSAVCGFPVPVKPVIVVVDAQLTIRAQPPDVQVVDRRSIVRWLASRPTTLSPDAVEAVYGHARRSTTWLETAPGDSSVSVEHARRTPHGPSRSSS